MKHLWYILIWTAIGLACSALVWHASMVLIDLAGALADGRRIDQRHAVAFGVRFINCRFESVANYGIWFDTSITSRLTNTIISSNKFISYGKTNY